jgi:hypothetical protein
MTTFLRDLPSKSGVNAVQAAPETPRAPSLNRFLIQGRETSNLIQP